MITINSFEQLENLDSYDNITVDDAFSNYLIDLYFVPNIKLGAKIAYNDNSPLSINAFKKNAETEIKKAVITFYKNKYNESNRNIISYLGKVIKYAALNIKYKTFKSNKRKIPKCPACKIIGYDIFLHEIENNLYECTSCETRLNEIKNSNLSVLQKEARIKFLSAFKIHSKHGVRCPDCRRFVPSSISDLEGNICCPYIDCFCFFKESDAKIIAHPVKIIQRNDLSMDGTVIRSSKHQDFINLLPQISNSVHLSSKVYSQDKEIQAKEDYKYRLLIIKKCIIDYKNYIIKNSSTCTCTQMQLMCDAYMNVLNNSDYQAEMISYLFNNKGSGSNSLQSKIFQEYANIIMDYLPFQIKRRNKLVDICNLCDPNLALFEQISQYSTNIEDGVINNETKELYSGSRGGKFYGKYYIGMIIDVVCEGKSIKHLIRDYSFHNIVLSTNEFDGKKVDVTHYSILPHYEIGSLVYLRKVKTELLARLERALKSVVQ